MTQKVPKDRKTGSLVQAGVRIPSDIKARLKDIAKKEDRTYSKVVIRALSSFIKSTEEA